MNSIRIPSNETTAVFFNTVLYKLFKYYTPDELVDLLDQMYADGRYYNSRKTQHLTSRSLAKVGFIPAFVFFVDSKKIQIRITIVRRAATSGSPRLFPKEQYHGTTSQRLLLHRRQQCRTPHQ